MVNAKFLIFIFPSPFRITFNVEIDNSQNFRYFFLSVMSLSWVIAKEKIFLQNRSKKRKLRESTADFIDASLLFMYVCYIGHFQDLKIWEYYPIKWLYGAVLKIFFSVFVKQNLVVELVNLDQVEKAAKYFKWISRGKTQSEMY